MLSLDEAITHAMEVADEQERQADFNSYRFQTKHIGVYERQYKKCLECASEHRQLAEWLKELKKWRTLRDSINMLCDVDCEYPQYRESETMCDACPIGTVKEYFEQIFDEGVNADG